MTSGYSGIPLLKKLGIKAEMKVELIGEPLEYFQWLDADISSQLCNKNEIPDFIHLFVKNKKEFESAMKKMKRSRTCY